MNAIKAGWQILTTLILLGALYYYYEGILLEYRGFGGASLSFQRGNAVMICLIGLCCWVGMWRNNGS